MIPMITLPRSVPLALTFALLAVALVSPPRAAGQARGAVPLFLAIPESFPDVDGRVVLLREPGRDVVLLRSSDATPETLSVALTLRRRLNATTPLRERQGQMVPVTGYVRSAPLPEAEWERLRGALTRLEGRPAASLGSLGRGRVMPFRED